MIKNSKKKSSLVNQQNFQLTKSMEVNQQQIENNELVNWNSEKFDNQFRSTNANMNSPVVQGRSTLLKFDEGNSTEEDEDEDDDSRGS